MVILQNPSLSLISGGPWNINNALEALFLFCEGLGAGHSCLSCMQVLATIWNGGRGWRCWRYKVRRALGLLVCLCSVSPNTVGPLRSVLEVNTPKVSVGHKELAKGCAGNMAEL